MHRGAWQAMIHAGVTKELDMTEHACTHKNVAIFV